MLFYTGSRDIHSTYCTNKGGKSRHKKNMVITSELLPMLPLHGEKIAIAEKLIIK